MPPRRCVVQDCDRVADKELGISIHTSPGTGSERAMWKRFVSQHRKHFQPKGTFGICSLHFTNDCFTRSVYVKGIERRLKPGSVPTIWKKASVSLSERSRRRILNEVMAEQSQVTNTEPGTAEFEENQEIQENVELQDGLGLQAVGGVHTTEVAEMMQVAYEGVHDEDMKLVADDGAQAEVTQKTEEAKADEVLMAQVTDKGLHNKEVMLVANDGAQGEAMMHVDERLQTEGLLLVAGEGAPAEDVAYRDEVMCTDEIPNQVEDQELLEVAPCELCKAMKTEITRLKAKVTRLKNKLSSNQEQWVQTFQEIQEQNCLFMVNAAVQTEPVVETEDISPTKSMDQPTEQDEDVNEEETDEKNTRWHDDDDPTWDPEKIDSDYQKVKDEDDSDKIDENPKLDMQGKDIREEPKGIVFLSKLLLLFEFCHLCFFSKPKVAVTQTGTMLTIQSECSNCGETFTWKSQPDLLGRFPAGNLLLSFAVLCAGTSIRKVLLVFRHMGLLVYHEPTYYYHQRHLLIPSVVAFWRKYQAKLLDKLKDQEVVLAGDGRHDSMGHSAKYGTYTIFCCTIGLIVHIVLVQANQAGSSSGMEFLAFQKAFTFLLGTGMIIKSFISDRHTSIAKWMREDCARRCREIGKPVVQHFFDIWHIAKKIQKVLTKLSKEKQCDIIGRWRKACVRHFYWAVTSTKENLGEVKLAKFHAFLSHVLNKHTDLPNRRFNACAHGIITTPRVWMTKVSEAYEKLYAALNKASLTKAIEKASSAEQTSCLEGYHSVVNQFAPKMYAYSYLGMLCRTIMAALHFNFNLKRETKVDDKGQPILHVKYPKFKEGEATVREAKVASNYDYVAEIYKTLTTTPRADLKLLEEELKQEVPSPVHSMLEDKEDKGEAIDKYKRRKEMETAIIPPTCTEEELQETNVPSEPNERTASGRRPPHYSKCGKPRRGHKRDQCQSEENNL